MFEAIVTNAHDIDPNAKLIDSGYRNVNGKKIMWAYIDAEAIGLQVRYYFHIYTGSGGTIQLIGFTTTNVFERKIEKFEEVFASFTVKP
ncbi:MAG: hypothetical protein ACI9MF_002783 [Gammaproteobacteria bacterium]|jgi:hypothetical protein